MKVHCPWLAGVRLRSMWQVLHCSTSHDAPEDILAVLQLRNPILEKLSLPLGCSRLRSNRLHLCICQTTHEDGREDLFKPPYYMVLDDLGCDVCDECLLRDLV